MVQASPAVRRAVAYGWMPLLALAATTALESGERQSLSQAVDGIQHTFHVSDTAIGFLPFAMALVGVVGGFPIGSLADRMRRTALLAVAVLVWTVCMGLNGLATSYALLFVFRLGVGAVEATGPATVSLISDYYPARERAKYLGLYQSGALIGAIVGLGLGGVAVQIGGWRWAFWMWVPLGVLTVLFLQRQPEPRRGDQDADFADDLVLTQPGGSEVGDLALIDGLLPEPTRTGELDYATASPRQVGRELLRIRSMWFGVLVLTISQLLLSGLQFWAVPYFKRVHHLGAAGAGGLTALLGLSSVVGILGGGFVSDRYLKRGVLCARVYVVAFASIAASVVLVPAFASTNLAVTAVLFVIGGVFLTLPIAPVEALVSDVVVAELRGRASAVRSAVRSIGSAGALIIGAISTALIHSGMSRADGLRWAIVGITPVYAVGGLMMLFAVRHYPKDLAFVVAESRRVRPREEEPPPPTEK